MGSNAAYQKWLGKLIKVLGTSPDELKRRLTAPIHRACCHRPWVHLLFVELHKLRVETHHRDQALLKSSSKLRWWIFCHKPKSVLGCLQLVTRLSTVFTWTFCDSFVGTRESIASATGKDQIVNLGSFALVFYLQNIHCTGITPVPSLNCRKCWKSCRPSGWAQAIDSTVCTRVHSVQLIHKTGEIAPVEL